MRVETTTRNLYTLDELSEKAQEAALLALWDLNVDHEWWDQSYEDAANVGVKITGFDLGRSWDIDLEVSDPVATADKILEQHGPTCDTYQEAETYLKARKEATASALQTMEALQEDEYDNEQERSDTLADAEYDLENTLADLDHDFTKALGECYLQMLHNDYEYLTSEEAIKETIEANEYEFTEGGELA